MAEFIISSVELGGKLFLPAFLLIARTKLLLERKTDERNTKRSN